MIPSYTWFPRSLAERVVWFDNFNTQFAIVADSLGLTAKVSSVERDNAVVQFLADSFVQVEAYQEAVGAYRRIITEGAVGEPTPAFPAAPNLALPSTVATGIFQRLTELRAQILAADAYTDEIGALLGIKTSTASKPPAQDVKLKVKVSTAATGYVYTVIAENRVDADSFDVYILRKGAANWEFVRTVTGKSIDLIFTPTTAGEPEQFQLRIQGRRKNQNYGQPSDPTYVTANP